MGNGPAQFGRFSVNTTADLGLAIGAGALDSVDLALLQGVWKKAVPDDVDLFTALDATDEHPEMRAVVAKLLQDQSRLDYFSIARGHLGHLRRFAPSAVVTNEVRLAIERKRAGGGVLAHVGDFANRGRPKRREKPQAFLNASSVTLSWSDNLGSEIMQHRQKAIVIAAQTTVVRNLGNVFKLWNSLATPQAQSQFASLRLALPYGICFRYGEFPGEDGKTGTVVEFGEATPEQMAEVLSSYRPDLFKPQQAGARDPDRGEEPVRFVLTEGIARRVLHWGYRLEAETYPDRLRVHQLLVKKLGGQDLDDNEKQYLADLQRREAKDAETALGIYAFLERMGSLELGAMAGRHNYSSSALARSLHTLINVIRGTWPIGDYFDARVRSLREPNRSLLPPTLPGGSLRGMISHAVKLFGHFQDLSLTIKIEGAFLDELSLVDDLDVVIDFSDVLINLIGNAFRYADPTRPLEIEISGSYLGGGMYEITVRDNGIGIEGIGNRMRLGITGFREGRKAVAESQGIGLASVAETLQKYGAPFAVLFDSTGESRGSGFRFAIPGRWLRKGGVPVKTENGAVRTAILKNLDDWFLTPAAFLRGEVLKEFVALAEQSPASLRAAINLQWAALHGENEEVKKAFADLSLRNLIAPQFESLVGDKPLDDEALFLFAGSGSLDAVLILDERAKGGSEEARIAMYGVAVSKLLDHYRRERTEPEKVLDALKRLIETSGNPDAVIGLNDLEPKMSEAGLDSAEIGSVDQRIIDLAKNVNVARLRSIARTSTEAKRALILLAGAGNEGALNWFDEQSAEELRQDLLTPEVVAVMRRLMEMKKEGN